MEERLSGQDLDPLAVWLGNASLGAELLPTWASLPPECRPPMPQLLATGDGLARYEPRAEVTVMNPPDGRVRLAAAERERWAESLFGHANRFGLFLHAAIERTAPGGLIGAVVPTSFLGGAYYQRLRELIASQAPLVRLVFVDERSGVFGGDVLQETCLAVFRRGQVGEDVICSTQRTNGGQDLRALGGSGCMTGSVAVSAYELVPVSDAERLSPPGVDDRNTLVWFLDEPDRVFRLEELPDAEA